MTDRPARTLLDRLSETVLSSYDRDRREHPHRFIGSPDGLGSSHLFVENVARMLGCNVDHVRRIPRAELPAAKIGQRLIYARADIEAYIAAQRDRGAARLAPSRTGRILQPVARAASAQDAPESEPFNPTNYVRKIARDRRK